MKENEIARIINSNINDWTTFVRKKSVCKSCGSENVNKLISNPYVRPALVLCIACFSQVFIHNTIIEFKKTLAGRKSAGLAG